MNKKIIIALGIVVVLVLIATGIYLNLNNQKEGDNTLVLGMDDSFPPMGFGNGYNELVGLDMVLAQEVIHKGEE